MKYKVTVCYPFHYSHKIGNQYLEKLLPMLFFSILYGFHFAILQMEGMYLQMREGGMEGEMRPAVESEN